MIKKIFRILCGLVILVGIFIVIGTAGSSDLGLIDTTAVIERTTLGILLVASGWFGLWASDNSYPI